MIFSAVVHSVSSVSRGEQRHGPQFLFLTCVRICTSLRNAYTHRMLIIVKALLVT